MTESQGLFPARPLFVLTAKNMARNVLRSSSPMGERSVRSPIGGELEGDRLGGTILPGLASEWQLASLRVPGLAYVNGLISLLPEGGTAIMMKYVGRRAGRYGDNCWRIGIGFEAAIGGPHEWLNDVVAVAQVEEIGADLRFTVHELLRRNAAVDEAALPVEPLYAMRAAGSIGERHIINSPTATRYLTIAEEGATVQGRLTGRWPEGFSWGPHRCASTPEGGYTVPLHIDMTAGIVSGNGDVILQSYLGTTPTAVFNPDPDTDRSWLTVATFEAPFEGDNAYLNEVIALGIGWGEDNEACYNYRIWT